MTGNYYLVLFLFFISTVLFTISCTQEKIEPFKSEKIPDTIVKRNHDSNNIDSVRKVKEDEYLKNLEIKEKKKTAVVAVSKQKNLTKEVLLGFIPEQFDGFEQLPPMTGKMIENDTAVTVYVRRQFKGKNRTLLFDIFDYGRGNPVTNAQMYEMVPTDLDAPAYPVELPGAKGFFYWLEQKVYGHIEVIADKRFIVKVRLNGFNRDDKLLKEYLNKINIKSLIKTGKN